MDTYRIVIKDGDHRLDNSWYHASNILKAITDALRRQDIKRTRDEDVPLSIYITRINPSGPPTKSITVLTPPKKRGRPRKNPL